MEVPVQLTARILKNTQRLITLYNTSPGFRKLFDKLLPNPRVTYQGQPLRLYLRVITTLSPRYRMYEKQVWSSPEKFGDFLIKFYRNRQEFGKFENALEAAILSKGAVKFLSEKELALAEKVDNIPEGEPKKAQLIDQLEQELKKSRPEVPPEHLPQPTASQPLNDKPEVTKTAAIPIITESKIPAGGKKIEPPVVEKVHPKYSTNEELKRVDELMGIKKEVPQLVTPKGERIPPTTPLVLPIIQKVPPVALVTIERAPPIIPISPATPPPSATSPAPTPSPTPPVQEKITIGQRLSVIRQIKVPEPVQNIAKEAVHRFNKLAIRNTPTVISVATGSMVGLAVGHPFVGALGGAVLPQLVKSGVAPAALKGGFAASSVLKGLSLSNPYTAALAIVTSPKARKMVMWIAIGIVAAFFLIFNSEGLNKTSALFPPYEVAYSAPIPPGGGPGGGGPPVTSSCTFTRSGVSAPYASPILYGWISAAASSQGIPPAVLASIARHESPDFTTNTNDIHDGIKSNYYCQGGQVFCEKNGQVLKNSDGTSAYRECTAEETQSGAKTAQAKGLMQLIDIYNTNINVCSITDNIGRGAQTIKAKIGSGSFDNETQLKTAVCRYFGVDDVLCPYGGGDYGQEVWSDYQKCKATPLPSPAPTNPIGISLTCPVDNFRVTCGTAANPVNNCGHGVPPSYTPRCDPYYYACDTLSTKYGDGTYEKYSKALYYAIDVVGTNEVKLPYINGNETVTWTKAESNPIPIGKNAEWGYRINFTATSSQGKKLYLDLTHLSGVGLNTKKSLMSGEILGAHFTTPPINHLHISLSIDGRWVEPIQDARMCTN